MGATDHNLMGATFTIAQLLVFDGCRVDTTWAPIATPPLFDLMDSSVIACHAWVPRITL